MGTLGNFLKKETKSSARRGQKKSKIKESLRQCFHTIHSSDLATTRSRAMAAEGEMLFWFKGRGFLCLPDTGKLMTPAGEKTRQLSPSSLRLVSNFLVASQQNRDRFQLGEESITALFVRLPTCIPSLPPNSSVSALGKDLAATGLLLASALESKRCYYRGESDATLGFGEIHVAVGDLFCKLLLIPHRHMKFVLSWWFLLTRTSSSSPFSSHLIYHVTTLKDGHVQMFASSQSISSPQS